MTWLRLRRATYLEFRLTPDMPDKNLFFRAGVFPDAGFSVAVMA